jgi:hypothetical protein
MDDSHEQLKYPIGRYETPERYEPELQNEWIVSIEALPSWLDACVENLDAPQLETPYGKSGDPSPRRQSHECLYPIETGTHRR